MNRWLVIGSIFCVVGSSFAIAGAKEFSDDDFAKACADVLDNSERFEYWEGAVEKVPARLSFSASSLSKANATLVGDGEFRMGARLMPVRAGIDISDSTLPPDLKKGSRFVVVGKIESGTFWGNVFEGCYLNIKANEILSDGF